MKRKMFDSVSSAESAEEGQENGYCHTFNVVGGTSYAIVRSVERFPDRCTLRSAD